jgi:UrcA family protein
MHSLTRTLIGAVVALLICGAEAALFASAASAAQPEQQSLTVRYQDLNLGRPADVAKLYHRLELAADNLCGPRLLTGSHLTAEQYQRCFEDAVAQAVARVDRPALNAYHQQQLALAPRRDATIARR